MRQFSLAILLALCIVAASACTTREIEQGDRDLVLKIEQLQPYGLKLPEEFASFESFKREQWIDGSLMVEYEFQAPDELDLPYIYSIAERHPSARDACASYSAGNIGYTLRIGRDTLSVRDDLFRFGDKSRFALLVNDDNPYGNYFGMCHGKTAFMVTIGGFYFDDGELWAELINPTLDAVSQMN